MKEILRNISAIPGLEIQTGKQLRDMTSFRIGGPAEILATAGEAEAVCQLLRECRKASISCHVMGHGTNLLASDKGVRGVVLRLKSSLENQEFSEICGDEFIIRVGAGMPLAKLVATVRDAGGIGYAVLAGIPGTVGGAIAMNAGTREGAIGDKVISVTLAGAEGSMTVPSNALGFAYRTCRLPAGTAIVSATLRFQLGTETTRERERSLFQSALDKRAKSQPHLPSAGCTFINPSVRSLPVPTSSETAPSKVSHSPTSLASPPSPTSTIDTPSSSSHSVSPSRCADTVAADASHSPSQNDFPLSAGALIDRAGLKGITSGGATISPIHANFTVNESGMATAADVLTLMKKVQLEVAKMTGIHLSPEVRLIGDFSSEQLPEFSRFSPDLTASSVGLQAKAND